MVADICVWPVLGSPLSSHQASKVPARAKIIASKRPIHCLLTYLTIAFLTCSGLYFFAVCSVHDIAQLTEVFTEISMLLN